MLANFADGSDRVIAKQLGVAHATLSAIRDHEVAALLGANRATRGAQRVEPGSTSGKKVEPGSTPTDEAEG